MVDWKTRKHLEDHFGEHHRELRVRSSAEYDASAQETIEIGVRFTFRDRITVEPRSGYFHRDTSRFTATDLDGLIRTHFLTDEAHVAGLPRSTWRTTCAERRHLRSSLPFFVVGRELQLSRHAGWHSGGISFARCDRMLASM